MDKKTIGIQRLKEILGEKAESTVDALSAISPDFATFVVEHGYADIYTRDGMSDKHRELAAVACLIGQGNTGLPLRAHLKGMLNVGWTKDDIIELIILLTGYCGFPSCVDAIVQLGELLASND